MKQTHKMLILLVTGIVFLMSQKAFSEEKQTEEGFIPQMMQQVHGSSFALTDIRSNTVLEIGGSKFSAGPKVLLTFRFGN